MANLLDTINQNAAAAATQPQGVTDESQKVANLLRAKSGKAATGGDVGASNLGETSASDQTNTQLQNQVAPAAAIQAANLSQQNSQQEQGAQIQKASVARGRASNTLQNKLQTTALLNQFEQNEGSLGLDKNKAQVDQLAQGLRLQNQQYVDDLNREGSKSRLDDQLQFQQAMQSEAFDNNKELQSKVFADQDIASMSDRDFKKRLEQMGIDDAWNMFNTNQKTAADRAKFTAIGSLASAGIGAAASAGTPSAPAAAPASSGQNMSTGTPSSGNVLIDSELGGAH